MYQTLDTGSWDQAVMDPDPAYYVLMQCKEMTDSIYKSAC